MIVRSFGGNRNGRMLTQFCFYISSGTDNSAVVVTMTEGFFPNLFLKGSDLSPEKPDE